MQHSKSEAGQQAFKARSGLFSARQRSAFILFDGVKTNAQVLAATAGLGITLDDIDYLVKQGFLEASLKNLPSPLTATSIEAVSVDEASNDSVSTRSPQERYRDAMPLATKVTASLGLRGFRLNLAVEAASGYDDLLALLPKIQALAGEKACIELDRALKG
ncbi:MAG TPA: hypothetical protein PLC34_11745 [Burkholderiaceae bacterium]|nr:hypothetical protein [Burkholderiaceae bacterium]